MVASGERWHILRFSSDEICTAWQDVRLAGACDRVWNDAGRPAGFEILQTAGEGDYWVQWFVSAVAAEVLDRHGVSWRQFLTGDCDRPPDNAHNALRHPPADASASGRDRKDDDANGAPS